MQWEVGAEEAGGRAYNLSDDEGRAQQEARALDEAPAARPRHEDEGLADDAHLQVQGRHHLPIAAPNRSHVERVLQWKQDEVIYMYPKQ